MVGVVRVMGVVRVQNAHNALGFGICRYYRYDARGVLRLVRVKTAHDTLGLWHFNTAKKP